MISEIVGILFTSLGLVTLYHFIWEEGSPYNSEAIIVGFVVLSAGALLLLGLGEIAKKVGKVADNLEKMNENYKK